MYFLENDQFGDAAPSCTSSQCSAVSVDRFDKMPADLLRVLNRSFKNAAGWFANLSPENRLALIAIYNRLCKYKLWCHVTSVIKIESGEKPVSALHWKFDVPGSTPSVFFNSSSEVGLLIGLLETGRFCLATGLGASLHPGQHSFREISKSDSMHVSIGPGNQFDVHIDKYSSVTEHPGKMYCPNAASVEAITHIAREAAPGLVNALLSKFKLRLPGLQFFPDFGLKPPVPQPEPTSRQDAGPPPPLVSVEFRGPRPRTARRPVPKAGPALSEQVLSQIENAIKNQVRADALVPVPVLARLAQARKALEFAGPFEEDRLRKARDDAQAQATSYPDPIPFAVDLAERMEHARRSGVTWVKIDLPFGYDFGSRKAIAGQIGKIAIIVRNLLPDNAKGVRTIVVIFGSGNTATREEVKLP